MLLAAVPCPLGVLHATHPRLLEAPLWPKLGAALVGLLLLIAGLAIAHRPRTGRVLSTLAIAGGFGLGLPQLLTAPLSALSALIAGTASLVLLWKVGAPLIEINRVRRRPLLEARAQGAAILSLGLWLLWTLGDAHPSPIDTLVVGWPVLIACAHGLVWALRHVRLQRARAWSLLLALALGAALASAFWTDWWWMMSGFVVPAATIAALLGHRPRLEIERASIWEPLLGHPERLFVGTFAALCAFGAILLALPQSASSGQGIGFSDAAFTATSAVCVTGLAVLDTPVDFSAFGQLVILVLIQVGGLGIMTFSTVALWALGRRMSLRHEGAVARLLSPQDHGRVFATATRVLQLTAVVEGLGAAVLSAGFMLEGDAPGRAIWRGLFTSISAFCNAGFALQSDSLVGYQQSPLVLHVVSALIVLGGLSPLALAALLALVRRSVVPMSAQAGLGLVTTALLLFVGFGLILAFEWDASLRGLALPDKLHNAWFQSVTLRTAGFNSVDLTLVTPATYMLMLFWMFVGGSPGGTAGGVKTTTIAVLVLSVVGAIRGQWTLETFGKRVPSRTLARAISVVVIAATTGMLALLAMLLTQNMPTKLAVFEVVSALGTAGLSIGGTAALDGIGKAIIIICMFVGRVGGLTLLLFMSTRQAQPSIGRPEEEIDVG